MANSNPTLKTLTVLWVAALLAGLAPAAAPAAPIEPQCLPCPDGQNYPVHLTFDDGPHPALTPRILDDLKEQKVKATFFVLGEKLEKKSPQYQSSMRFVRQIIADGHVLASHSNKHLDHITGKESLTERQINLERAWGDYQGPHSQFLRFPYGNGWLRFEEPELQARRQQIMKFTRDLGYTHMGWDIDSFDWHKAYREYAPGSILQQVCNHHGGIILMHDIQPWTAENLKSIIKSLRCSGHTLVDLDTMLSYHKKSPRLALEDNVANAHFCHWRGPDVIDQVYRECSDKKPTRSALTSDKSEGRQ